MRISNTVMVSTALFLSLVGNLLLGGIVAGGHLGRHDSGMNPVRPLYRLTKELPPASAEKLRAIIEPSKNQLMAKHKVLMQQRDRIHALLQTDPIDKKELEQAFSAYRALSADIQQQIQTLDIQAALALPPQERKALIEPSRRD